MLCHTPSSVAGILKHFEIHTSFQNSYEQIKYLNSLLYQDCIYGTKSLAEAQGLRVKKKIKVLQSNSIWNSCEYFLCVNIQLGSPWSSHD